MAGKTRESEISRPQSGESDTPATSDSTETQAGTRPTDDTAHAEEPDTEQKTDTGDAQPTDGGPPHPRRPDRAGLLVAGAVLAACGGLVLYGVLDTGQDGDSKPEHHTPTAAVTYEVTGQGTADITYQARSETGQATVVKAAQLPWRETVHVPLGQDPTVNIVLGERGGQARCALTIRGKYVQSATASGEFGRATCTGTLSPTDAADSRKRT